MTRTLAVQVADDDDRSRSARMRLSDKRFSNEA
jgi:hypothetical protein